MYVKIINFQNIDKIKGEIFNIGSGRQINIGGVVDKIIELTGINNKINWNKVDRRIWEPQMWQADIFKTKEIFDWQPKVSLADGLEKTIGWFKNNLKYYE